LHGIEVKVSRSDWRTELKNPQKAEAVARYCDFWWVAAPKGVVPVAEVPAGWGLIEFDGKRWSHAKPAPKKEAEPITRQFLAPFLRRACEIDDEEVNALVQKALESERKKIDERIEREVKLRSNRAQNLITAVEQFQKASGINIDSYDLGYIGAAVEVARALGIPRDFRPSALTALQNLEAATQAIRRALADAGIQTEASA
jgi:hypothetical protein